MSFLFWTLVQFLAPLSVLLFWILGFLLPVMVWMERKVEALIQDRHGPSRTHLGGLRWLGMVHNLAVLFRSPGKEDRSFDEQSPLWTRAAPFLLVLSAWLPMALLPFGESVQVGSHTFHAQMAPLNTSTWIVLFLLSLQPFAFLLAGADSRAPLVRRGVNRSVLQSSLALLLLWLAVGSATMAYGSADLAALVQTQGHNAFTWGLLLSPLGAFLAWIALMMLQERSPFDLTGGRTELLTGAFLGYSGLSFDMARSSRSLLLLTGSGLWVTLFLGGWQVPFLSNGFLQQHSVTLLTGLLLFFGILLLMGSVLLISNILKPLHRWGDRRDRESHRMLPLLVGTASVLFALALVVLPQFSTLTPLWLAHGTRILFQLLAFSSKLLLVALVTMWVQASLPRFRLDQVLRLGWHWWLPMGLANFFITGLWSKFWLHFWGVL